jgi:hypothetical protein
MEEARVGVTSILEKISLLPVLREAVAPLDKELDDAIQRAREKSHEGHDTHGHHGHTHGHTHGHSHG